jgi:hypothetical protein
MKSRNSRISRKNAESLEEGFLRKCRAPISPGWREAGQAVEGGDRWLGMIRHIEPCRFRHPCRSGWARFRKQLIVCLQGFSKPRAVEISNEQQKKVPGPGREWEKNSL